jgi:hypothetical protein
MVKKYWGSDAPKKIEPAIKSKVTSDVDTQRVLLLGQIQRALTNNGGIESNIPHTHEYWKWINEYRTLTPQPAPQPTPIP